MAFGKAVVWPQAGPGSGWIWGRRADLFWIAGGGFFVALALIAPLAVLGGERAGSFLNEAFLKLAIVCNYPHYIATYQVLVRERTSRPRNFRILLVSTVVMLGVLALVASVPDLFWGPVVRLYLTWSAHHYAAQHFGMAAMYSARFGRPLAEREKRPLQAGFLGIGVFMMLMANTVGGDPAAAARVVGLGEDGGAVPIAAFPDWIYLPALGLVLASVGAAILAERRLAARSGRGFEPVVWLLFATNVAWFVVPHLRIPGREPWLPPALVLALYGAPAFFHCAQYLAVTAHRSLQSGPMRPIVTYAILVWGGWMLFNGTAHLGIVPAMFAIDELRGLLLVVTVINLHHFWVDGLIWRRAKAAPGTVPAPSAEPPPAPIVAG